MNIGIKFMRFSFLVVWLLLFTMLLKAQVIKGRITDAENGKPIAGASVYLNSTYQGTSSDKEGNFIINSSERNIPLIVSYVGYQSQTISNYAGKTLSVLLVRKANILKEVAIGTNNREEEMKIFLREFIGTENRECTIKNPDVISFVYHKKTGQLIATAEEPLIIYNKKLGYKVTYFLADFNYESKEVSILGNYFFAEDTTGLSIKDKKKISKARDDVYYGSRMHFIRSLWANDFNKEGFEVVNKVVFRLGYKDIITESGNQKFIKSNTFLDIAYKFYWSQLSLIDTAKKTLIEANGYYDNNISWSQAMSKQRMGELLPFEFEPSDKGRHAGLPAKTNNVTTETISNTPLQDSLIKKFEYYSAKKQQGVLFAHFDKTIYTNNENVWFTAYLLNARANKNDVLSVILVNDNDRSVAFKERFVMDKGIAFGNLFLPDTIASGNYSFMLYANSVINNRPENVFIQPVTIKNTNTISYKATLFMEDTAKIAPVSGRRILLMTQMQTAGVKFVAGATVKYSLGDSHHPIIAGTVKTDAAGQYLFTIPPTDIPLGNNILQAQITYGKEVQNVKLELPVQKNTPVIRFYPEGGNPADGLASVVGWEVKNTAGVPYSVRGILYRDNKPIDTISTNSYGMGSFTFSPHLQSRYYVKLMLDGMRDSVYNLPSILSNVPVITIANAIAGDTLRFTLKSKAFAKLNVVVHNYNQTFFSFPVEANAAGRKVKIALADLPKGLAEVTILDSLQQPYAERLFFAHYDRNNNVDITIDSSTYKTRQKVNLKLNLSDKNGNPIPGYVSIAVVQANRMEVKHATDIESYLYLNYDLGNLPVKQNYLGKQESDKTFLENILLIKGWRRYSWMDLIKTTIADTSKKYDSVLFKGNITHFDKPLKKPVNYIIMKDSALNTGLTSSSGGFTLTNNDILIAEGKQIHLFVNGDANHEDNFKIIDPYDKINKLLISNYQPLVYSYISLNGQPDNIDDLKGFEHARQLKEVKIKAANDEIYGQTNECGDYYCIYNILNCPNHRYNQGNKAPIKGVFYSQYDINTHQLKSVRYAGCVGIENDRNAIDGIHFSMEFYPSDYSQISPTAPEFLSTIYWNHFYNTAPGKEKPISFYTSDITGEFKIIVQGITNKDVIYGEKTFTVSK